MSDRPAYPRRESHFAHRFVRVLHKSCAAQDIGPAACYLLCVIAHTEDAGRYTGPARFWRSQLMETLGFKSPKQLGIAREKAIDAGWLVYHQGGTRAVGEYFVTIPQRFAGLSDSAIEPGEAEQIGSAISSASGTNENCQPAALVPPETHQGNFRGNESGPLPIPIPTPKRERARFQPPTAEEVTAYCRERGNAVDPQHFINHYTANGWRVGRNPMKDWRAAVRTWERNGIAPKTLSAEQPSMYRELAPRRAL